jgi:hypothetical protein
VVLIAVGILLVIISNPRNSGSQCGVDRWPVKTLSDPGEREIDFVPIPTLVERLRRLHRPTVRSKTKRIKPVEKTAYTIHVSLVAMKRKPDHDIDVVVAASRRRSQTMVAAFPDVACRGAKGSRERAKMQRARTDLVTQCVKPTIAETRLTGTATITGITFFGDTAGLGAAPNGIQLHPVLDFKSSDCQVAKHRPVPLVGSH